MMSTRIARNTCEVTFQGRILNNDSTLAACGIHDGDLLGIQGNLSSTLVTLPEEPRMVLENLIRYVRFDAHQVWGWMVGGDHPIYKHTTWFKRATHNLFGHVRAIHQDAPQEIVLEIDQVFKHDLVVKLYDFLWTLVLWWTSQSVIDQYIPEPANYRMQCTFMCGELALQPPFDGEIQDAKVNSRRLTEIKDAIRTCDDLHDEVLEVNKKLASEKKTPKLLKYLVSLSSSLKNLRDFSEIQETAQPTSKKQRVKIVDNGAAGTLSKMRLLLEEEGT